MARTQILKSCPRRALALVALTLAGCGGSGNGETTHPALAQTVAGGAQLIAKADPICRQLNVKLGRGSSRPLTSSRLARTSPLHAALEKAALARLSELKPPPGLAQDWNKMLADRRALAEDLLALTRAAKVNDTAAIHALGVTKAHLHRQLAEIARRDGFSDCGAVGGLRSVPRAAPSKSQPRRPAT